MRCIVECACPKAQINLHRRDVGYYRIPDCMGAGVDAYMHAWIFMELELQYEEIWELVLLS